MPKRTHQPKTAKRAKAHGWRTRLKSASGRKVIKRRRAKGRVRLSA